MTINISHMTHWCKEHNSSHTSYVDTFLCFRFRSLSLSYLMHRPHHSHPSPSIFNGLCAPHADSGIAEPPADVYIHDSSLGSSLSCIDNLSTFFRFPSFNTLHCSDHLVHPADQFDGHLPCYPANQFDGYLLCYF